MCERKQVGFGDGDGGRKRLKKIRPDRYDVSFAIKVLEFNLVVQFSK